MRVPNQKAIESSLLSSRKCIR